MKLELGLEQEQLKGIVSEAILRSLDDQKRDALVQQALQYLLTPQESGYSYGRKKTPLEEAFEFAIRSVAGEVVSDHLEQDAQVKERLNGLVAEAFAKALENDRERITDRLADAITSALTGEK